MEAETEVPSAELPQRSLWKTKKIQIGSLRCSLIRNHAFSLQEEWKRFGDRALLRNAFVEENRSGEEKEVLTFKVGSVS